MFKFLAGYRTWLGVITAMSGGIALLVNGISDSVQAGGLSGGTTKIGAGLFAIGTGLATAGIRWAPEFLSLLDALKLNTSTTNINTAVTNTNSDLLGKAASKSP